MSEARLPRVLVVGLGLIGASFALALRRSGQARVLGLDGAEGVAERALDRGVIDQAVSGFDDLPEFDVVLLAVPVLAMKSVLSDLKPRLGPRTVISDVGSVKGAVIEAARAALGEDLPAGFVPGHPIAGSEFSGLDASRPDLFRRHLLILTPLPSSDPAAVTTLTTLWQAVGAEVVSMAVERHDEVLAATSHLPHLLAFSLVDTLARESDNRDIFRYAAGGFRDFTRIAASDPTMWHDVFMANRDATLDVLHRFQADLADLAGAIERGESRALMSVFTRAKAARDYFSDILRDRESPGERAEPDLVVRPASAGLGGHLCLTSSDSARTWMAVHLAVATLVPGSDVRLDGVESHRFDLLDGVVDMGGSIELSHHRLAGGEPVADLRVRYAPLRAPVSAIDLRRQAPQDLPLLLVLLARAEGESLCTGLDGLGEIAGDRLRGAVRGLNALGAMIELEADQIRIQGLAGRPFAGGRVDGGGDHALALAFVAAGQVAAASVTVTNSGRVLGAYPGFADQAGRLGYPVTTEDAN